MLLTISLIGFTIVVISSFLKLVGIKLVGWRSNPFALFFGLNFFLISLPGIFFVASTRVDTILDSGMFRVSNLTIDYVTYSYFFN